MSFLFQALLSSFLPRDFYKVERDLLWSLCRSTFIKSNEFSFSSFCSSTFIKSNKFCFQAYAALLLYSRLSFYLRFAARHLESRTRFLIKLFAARLLQSRTRFVFKPLQLNFYFRDMGSHVKQFFQKPKLSDQLFQRPQIISCPPEIVGLKLVYGDMEISDPK